MHAASALAAEMPACGGEGDPICDAMAVTGRITDMRSDEFGVQFVQKKSMAKRLQSQRQEPIDDLLGDLLEPTEAPATAAPTTAAPTTTPEPTTTTLGYTCAPLDTQFWYSPFETDRSYSSVYQDATPGQGRARSALDSPQAWSCKNEAVDGSCYLIMDMGRETSIQGTLVQGRKDQPWELVTDYRASWSNDNITYFEIDQNFNYMQQSGRFKYEQLFPSPVRARYLKIKVTKYTNWPSMRVGAILYESTGKMMERVFDDGTRSWNDPPKRCATIYYDPCEAARSYSSVYMDEAPGTGRARSMLSSPASWSAKTEKKGHYMIMDLGQLVWAQGVITTGSADEAYKFATEFSIEVSLNGKKWYGNHVCPSGDYEKKMECLWTQPARVRYIKLVIQKWQEWPSIRAGVILCGRPGKEVWKVWS